MSGSICFLTDKQHGFISILFVLIQDPVIPGKSKIHYLVFSDLKAEGINCNPI